MKVDIIEPISYCSGVKRAIDSVYKISKNNKGKKIFLLGKIVNNNEVIKELNTIGVETINAKPDEYSAAISSIDEDSIVIFSAHGHDKFLETLLTKRNIKFYSTTCPIIDNTINTVKSRLENNHKIIFIGISNHPETVAFTSINENITFFDINTLKISDNKLKKNNIIDVFCQSTLSIDMIDEAKNVIDKMFETVNYFTDICPTTRARTNLLLNKNVVDADLLVIIGSKSSSNSTRLFENARKTFPQKTIIFCENIDEFLTLFSNNDYKHCALLSGTSTPMYSIVEIYDFLKNL